MARCCSLIVFVLPCRLDGLFTLHDHCRVSLEVMSVVAVVVTYLS